MTERGGTTDAVVFPLPDEPVPLRLMNTVWGDRHGVHDALCSPDDLAGWLTATGLGAGPVTPEHVEAFRSLRDALRRLAAQLTDDLRPVAAASSLTLEQAVEAVDAAAGAGPAGPRLQLSGSRLRREEAATGPAGALATVAGQAVALLTDEELAARLTACYAPGCALYFVKGHARQSWCSTACGNRVRAARHYDRHRSTAPAARQRSSGPAEPGGTTSVPHPVG